MAASNVTVRAPVGSDLHKTDFTTAASGVDVAGGFSDGDREQELGGDCADEQESVSSVAQAIGGYVLEVSWLTWDMMSSKSCEQAGYWLFNAVASPTRSCSTVT